MTPHPPSTMQLRSPVPRPRRRAGPVVLVLAALVLAAACTPEPDGAAPAGTAPTLPGGDVGSEPPPPTLPLPEGFVLPDTRGVVLPVAESKLDEGAVDHSKPILPVEGGEASLSGTVFGPDGPVDGAVVRLERFVGADFGVLDVATDGEGVWTASRLLGGRYRVRAWRRPDLATIEPGGAFLADEAGATATVDVTVEHFDGREVLAAYDRPDVAAGQAVGLRVLVADTEVSEDGIVAGAGVPGIGVQVNTYSGLELLGERTGLTGPDGLFTVPVRCVAPGAHSIVVIADGLPTQLSLDECREGEAVDPDATPATPLLVPSTLPPVPTVPTTRVATRPLPPSTTTTTRPGPTTSTTSTTVGSP